MPIYALNNVVPVVEEGAFVHPEAVLIGDVFVLTGAFVAPHATMRGDFGRLILGEGANLQEHCCMHGFPDSDTVVEKNGHIGHGSILHGCHIGENALIGMNSTVLDNASIGKNSILGAGSLVSADTRIGENKLALGTPAKEIREISEQEIAWKTNGTREYQSLTALYQNELKLSDAIRIADLSRPRLNISQHNHKVKHTNRR